MNVARDFQVEEMVDGFQTTSFASRPPNFLREIEIIRTWANNNQEEDNTNGELTNVIN